MDIQSNGIRIRVSEKGHGKRALVFLHYWGGSSRTWQFVMEELSDTYRTVATDHRGWGHSDAPEDGYTIADLADDAQGAIEALGLTHYVLVGHSMGGKVAQLLASRRPEGLEGLVLVAPSPPSPMLLPDEQRAVMMSAYESRESVGWVLDHVLTGRPLTPARREQVIADSLRGAPQAKAAWPNVAMREDITADVAAIDVPVLVIAGERDQVDRVETLQAELLPRIAHARLEVLPGIGHLSPLEAPSAVAAAIRQFVGELAWGSRTPEQVPAAFDTAFNAGDVDAVTALFSENATMRMTNGEVVENSREQLHRQFTELLKVRPRIANKVRRTLVSGDIALVLLDWTLTMSLHDGSRHTETGTATQVMERGGDGTWKLRISNPLGVS
ncbi:alpha/beta fold hydrolase [Trinickia fusca]|uniref:Alpha/beta fold hydrolase n=1 Tax=Trinickia fusca TaxID=2419777 RepID=A0A494XDX8_9BURK|nr:alpha/beta fold hydrolase [Trinickia fusca]RKP46359.1 alpha/beta fold hydrolase [Trinickia fusca]